MNNIKMDPGERSCVNEGWT